MGNTSLAHEEPNFHRVRAETPGQPAKVVNSRRSSSIVVPNNLRSFVRECQIPGRQAVGLGSQQLGTAGEMGFYGLQGPAQVTGDAGAEIIISDLTSLTEKFSQNHKAVDVVENNPMKIVEVTIGGKK